MLFRNIMVPFDGSSLSKHAFKFALDMAKKYQSKLTIVTCIGDYDSGSWYVDNRIAYLDFKRQYKAAKLEHKRLEDITKKSNVPFSSTVLQTPKIANTLANYAKSRKIDLIVMGSHGRTGWSKVILGSVSNGVLHTARCPILVVKNSSQNSPASQK